MFLLGSSVPAAMRPARPLSHVTCDASCCREMHWRGTIPNTMKKELLRALALQEHTEAPDVLKPTGWPRGEIHSGYWNLVPQSATDERCARYVGFGKQLMSTAEAAAHEPSTPPRLQPWGFVPLEIGIVSAEEQGL